MEYVKSDDGTLAEAEVGDFDIELPVEVSCPHCPISFRGPRDEVEEEVFQHLWRVHEEDALDYMLTNMYMNPDLRERIFDEMGPDYVSWIVDTRGELVDEN